MKVDNKDVENRCIETLTSERFKQLLKESSIEFPTITKCEIQDRSKGDAVAKFIAGIQTLWFVLQCFIRYLQGLAITELELTTIALAGLNVIVLWFWKDKPLNMSVQVPVYKKERPEGTTVDEEDRERMEEADTQQASIDPESRRTLRDQRPEGTTVDEEDKEKEEADMQQASINPGSRRTLRSPDWLNPFVELHKTWTKSYEAVRERLGNGTGYPRVFCISFVSSL